MLALIALIVFLLAFVLHLTEQVSLATIVTLMLTGNILLAAHFVFPTTLPFRRR